MKISKIKEHCMKFIILRKNRSIWPIYSLQYLCFCQIWVMISRLFFKYLLLSTLFWLTLDSEHYENLKDNLKQFPIVVIAGIGIQIGVISLLNVNIRIVNPSSNQYTWGSNFSKDCMGIQECRFGKSRGTYYFTIPITFYLLTNLQTT
jgi:hypothetical protein